MACQHPLQLPAPSPKPGSVTEAPGPHGGLWLDTTQFLLKPLEKTLICQAPCCPGVLAASSRWEVLGGMWPESDNNIVPHPPPASPAPL
jgi:hypothetical protein